MQNLQQPNQMNILRCTLFAVLLALVLGFAASAGEPFVIKVVDEATGRGVPLVKLSTVHKVNYLTDNAEVVAFDEPGLMHGPVFFTVSSHGYEFPTDGLGFRGRRLMAVPGKSATISIKRINIAERLCRVARTHQATSSQCESAWQRQRAYRDLCQQTLLAMGRHQSATLSPGKF